MRPAEQGQEVHISEWNHYIFFSPSIITIPANKVHFVIRRKGRGVL